MGRPQQRPQKQQPQKLQPVTFQAGCGRTWEILGGEIASREPDLAYTEQAFPECPTCPHLVEPEGANGVAGTPFCTLRPVNAQNPFAVLAGLLDDND